MSSHTEIECIVNVVRVIINLWCFGLGIDNLDCLILVLKNWLHDVLIGYVVNKPWNMHDFLSNQTILIKKHKKLILKKKIVWRGLWWDLKATNCQQIVIIWSVVSVGSALFQW